MTRKHDKEKATEQAREFADEQAKEAAEAVSGISACETDLRA